MKYKMMIVAVVAVIMLTCQGLCAVEPAPNPLLSGFHPDPSVCAGHDGAYYLTTSTFMWRPGLPIYRSEDFRTWSLVGHAVPDFCGLMSDDETSNFKHQTSNTLSSEMYSPVDVVPYAATPWKVVIFGNKATDLVARGLDVYAHGRNNDGIDIEMTKNVLVEDCRFDQGDDAIVIKAGRNLDAWRLATPSENIEVRNCTVPRFSFLLPSFVVRGAGAY